MKSNAVNYFVADRKDSVAGKHVFNRTVTLRDAWQKQSYQMRKSFRKSIKKDLPLSTESQIDIWLSRLSHFSQIGLLAVAAFGYVYTVIPVYQKSLLDEQIAQKELQLSSLQVKLNESYALNRADVVKTFVVGVYYRCNGVDKLPRYASDNFDKKLNIKQKLGEVFEIDIKECFLDPFYKSKKIKESLRAEDIEKLTKEVVYIGENLDKSKLALRTMFNKFEASVALNPETLNQIKLDHSFEYRMLEIRKSNMSKEDYESALFTAKVNQGLDDIRTKYSGEIHKELIKLTKIDWSKTTR